MPNHCLKQEPHTLHSDFLLLFNDAIACFFDFMSIF